MKLRAALALSSFLAFNAAASDHIDGPVTTKHAVGDISDFYAFPAPGNPNRLTVVLNAYPIVHADGHFSEKVNYSVIIRKVQAANGGFDTREEIRISCRSNDAHDPNFRMTCTSTNGLSAEAKVGAAQGRGNFALFAGMRLDPFFFNADWAESVVQKGKIPRPAKDNSMSLLNALSIVMEFDRSQLFDGEFGLLGLAAESTTLDGATVRRLDRIGRPEITNVTMAARGGADLRDQYNLEDPFAVIPENLSKYRAKIAENIRQYDALDGQTQWKPDEISALAGVLAEDYLVLDLAKPCAKDNFLSIELARLHGEEHASCGGRQLGDDIMDLLFNLYINGLQGPRVSDGIDAPSVAPATAFPYLTKPDLSPFARIKAWLAGQKIGRNPTQE